MATSPSIASTPAFSLPSTSRSHDINAISLRRLLHCLESQILSPTNTSTQLRSKYQRARIQANIEYARTLLFRQEHETASIKSATQKAAMQAALVRMRDLIARLNAKMVEAKEAAMLDEIEDEQELEHERGRQGEDKELDDADLLGIITTPLNNTKSKIKEDTTTSLRLRHAATHSISASVSTSSAVATGIALFPHSIASQHDSKIASINTIESNRETQDSLTQSLISLAHQLKNSTLAMHTSLEAEKPLLSSAAEGLDSNRADLQRTHARLGVLRRMSEGKGWLARMLMYLWIFGLMVLACVVVFVLPKLRF